MPYGNINSIPQSLKTAGLSLKQANDWARYYDEAKKQPGVTSAAAIAWKIFKQKYYKSGKTWVIKKKIKAENKIKKEKILFNPVIKNKIKIKEEEMKLEDIKGYELVYRSDIQPTSLEDVDAEGKVYEKELIREGEWAHPQKPSVRLKITLARMKKWVDNFNKGLFKVPVPKRHSLDPEDNRGWVKELEIRKNNEGKQILYGKLDITNDKMKKMIDNGDIQDVSVSVGDYRDNKGKRHGEVLQHVALTVIPHIDSQSGFSPMSAEGYICLEEVKDVKTVDKLQEDNNIVKLQAPDGSKEQEREDLTKAIITARLFPEEKSFYIVGTYTDKVILQYYGGGTGIGSDSGTPMPDRYFQIPYTKDLKGNFVFGDKIELSKKFYFVEKKFIKEPSVAYAEEMELDQLDQLLMMGEISFDAIAKREDVSQATKKAAIKKYGNVNYADEKNKKYPLDTPEHVRAAARYIGMPKNRRKYSLVDLKKIDNKINIAMKKFKIGKYATEKQIKEVSEMKEFEVLQEKHAELETANAELEAKVAEMEPKIAELEKVKTELEESNKVMKEQLDKIEVEKKAAFDKATEEKVSKLVEDGHILPAEQEDIKAVMLEGGKAAEMLEKTLKDRKAVDLDTKTKQGSKKPSEGNELTQEKIAAEAERISKGEAPSK